MTVAPPVRKRSRKPSGPAPFTLEHFKAWARQLVLDNGRRFVLQPFQEAFVADLFGDVREVWLVVPEGNGKTTLLAAVALYGCEFAPSAIIPVAASSREQAEVLYRQAEGLVLRTPRLQGVFRPQEGYRRVKNTLTGGRVQVFAADDRTGDGVIPFPFAILDELHRHRDLRLYRTWVGKLGKRGSKIIAISTAGEPGGEFEATRERIRREGDTTRDGCFARAVSGRAVMHEWAVPEYGDVEDMLLVKAANPHRGITVRYLTEKRQSPTMTLPHWRRFVCNLPTRGDAAAVQESEWEAAWNSAGFPEGVPAWAGLDVGWKWDTTSFVPMVVLEDGTRLLGPASILVPPRDSSSLSPQAVKDAIRDANRRNPIHTVVMDMTRAEDIAAWIEDELGATVIDRTQGNAMAALDYERFMEGLRSGALKHTGDAGLTRHVLNAVVRELPAGGARFDRPQANRRVGHGDQNRRVIDALIAAAMVNTAATESSEEPFVMYW